MHFERIKLKFPFSQICQQPPSSTSTSPASPSKVTDCSARYTAPATPHPLQRTHYTAPTHAHAHTQDVQPYSLRYCPVPIRPEGEDRVGDQKGRLQRKTSRSPAPLPCSSSVCTCSCPAVLAAAAAAFLPDSGILLCTRILLTDLTELPDHSPLTS